MSATALVGISPWTKRVSGFVGKTLAPYALNAKPVIASAEVPLPAERDTTVCVCSFVFSAMQDCYLCDGTGKVKMDRLPDPRLFVRTFDLIPHLAYGNNQDRGSYLGNEFLAVIAPEFLTAADYARADLVIVRSEIFLNPYGSNDVLLEAPFPKENPKTVIASIPKLVYACCNIYCV